MYDPGKWLNMYIAKTKHQQYSLNFVVVLLIRVRATHEKKSGKSINKAPSDCRPQITTVMDG